MEQSVPQTISYKEMRIGNTVYCVTSVFSPQKDLKKTLEDIAVRRVMTDISPTSEK